jgi:raffinose/stachyose/melibiose transport system substrate-binding protein
MNSKGVVKMKKYLCLLCTLCLVLSLTTGCAGKPAAVGNGSTEAAVSTAAASTEETQPAEKVKVSIMQNKVEIQTDLEKIVEKYNQSQNTAEIELLGSTGDNFDVVLQSAFAASPEKAATIFTMTGPSTVKYQQFFAEITNSKAADIIADGIKEEAMIDGKLVGLPTAVEGYGLIYNKAMFAEAGVDAASITSIDALADACRKLSAVKGVTSPLAFAKDNYFIFIHPFNWAFAVSKDYKSEMEKLTKGEIALKDIPTVKQFAADLDKLKPYSNKALDSYDDQIAGFANGKFAIIHQGCWVQQVLDQNNIQFEYGMMPLPTSGNTGIAVGPASFYRINNAASADQQKEAIAFLDWLITSDEGQDISANTLKYIPAYKGVLSPSAPLSKAVSDYVNAGKMVSWGPMNNYFPAGIDVDGANAMQKYYADAITSDQLLDELNKVWVKK